MRRRPTGDKGGSLVVVLILIAVAGLIGGALLSLTGTGVSNTVHLREQATRVYGGDGAVDAAINAIRNGSYTGAAGQQCFGASNTLTLPAEFAGPKTNASVSCTTDPARVMIHCPSLTNCNRPGSAILTLGTTADENGITIDQPTNSQFRVHGGVFSNSTVNVVKGNLTTNSWVQARGACSGTIASSPAAQCNVGASSNPFGVDPGYQPETTTVPVHRRLVYDDICTTRAGLVTFEPGYYDDAQTLSKMMSSSSRCKDSTFWFRPGVYYFDFHNSTTSANRNPLLTSGANIWEISNGYVVAGRPVNAAGTPIAAPPVPATIPGSCDNPINNPSASGVQFVFGGDSQLVVSAGEVEICGSYRVDRPPVALYGLKTGAEAVTSTTGLTATTVPTTGGFGTTATTGALGAVGGATATWNPTTGAATQTTTLGVGGFTQAADVPAGSILTSARLRITHRHNDTTQQQLSVKVNTGSSSSAAVLTPRRAGGSAYQTDILDVTTDSLLATAAYHGNLAAARFEITAALRKGQTLDVDAVQLEITVVKPALQGARGCVAQTGYTGANNGTCALVKTVNGSGKPLYVQGTTYTPKAALDLTLNNAAQQVFRFGVVTRTLVAKLTGSLTYAGPVIEVPDDSPGFGFTVYLIAYVCEGSTTCTPSEEAVRARVAFVDDVPSAPTPGQRQVIVLSWNHPG